MTSNAIERLSQRSLAGRVNPAARQQFVYCAESFSKKMSICSIFAGGALLGARIPKGECA
jgi:hypothetical protein